MKNGSALWIHWLKRVRDQPRKTVLIDLITEKCWSARAFHERCLATSLDLVEAGGLIALALPNGPAWMGFFLAAQRLQKSVISLDPAQPADQRRELAKNLGASCLVTEQSLEWLNPARRRYPRETVYLKITSGTTSTPKVWPCSALHLLADGRQVCTSMGIKPSDRNLGLVPMGHSYGLGNLVMPLLLQGNTLALAPTFMPAQIPHWIQKYRLSVFPTVPAVLRILAQLPNAKTKSLRLAISAGAPLPRETALAFKKTYGLIPRNFYGSSETGGIAYDRSGVGSLRGDYLGKPLRGVKLRIVDHQRVEVTSAAVLTRNSRHVLADQGMIDAAGRLKLLGRGTAAANIGGRKVLPSEVQQLLQNHPGVHESLVWVVKHEGRDSLATAVETQLPREVVHRYLSERLSAWKIPKHWHVRAELPRTNRGKLDLIKIQNELKLF